MVQCLLESNDLDAAELAELESLIKAKKKVCKEIIEFQEARMNSFIETLNQWGGQFLNFAWPMLWQSSLLIAFVFALDFLIRRENPGVHPLCALAGRAGETVPATDAGHADERGVVAVPKQTGSRGSGDQEICRHL